MRQVRARGGYQLEIGEIFTLPISNLGVKCAISRKILVDKAHQLYGDVLSTLILIVATQGHLDSQRGARCEICG